MNIEILIHGDNYIYLIVDDGCAAVVDPSSAKPVLGFLERSGVDLSAVLITHDHSDHTAGCSAIKKATGCSIIGPQISTVDNPVSDEDVVSPAGIHTKVLAIPGHTREHLGYYVSEAKALFTGDMLFVSGCGRIFGGTAEDMWSSLVRLRSFPDDTLVYCGHEYTEENLEFALNLEPENNAINDRLQEVRRLIACGKYTVPSTIEQEKLTNPFLRADTDKVRKAVGMLDAEPWKVFAEIRKRKDRW